MSRAPARRALLAGTGLFALLAGLAATVGVLPGDVLLRQTILGLVSPAAVAMLRIVNHVGSWPVLLPATLLLLAVFPAARQRAHVWVGLMVLAPLTEGLTKVLVARPRPEGVSFGFPSGHATATAAFLGAVVYLTAALPPAPRRLARALAVALIALVGLARVALRAHWPSDVLGGVALGLALASAAALLGLAPRPQAGQ